MSCQVGSKINSISDCGSGSDCDCDCDCDRDSESDSDGNSNTNGDCYVSSYAFYRQKTTVCKRCSR